MTLYVNDSGVVKAVKDIYVNDDGVIKRVDTAHVNNGGTVQQFFASYIGQLYTLTSGQISSKYGTTVGYQEGYHGSLSPITWRGNTIYTMADVQNAGGYHFVLRMYGVVPWDYFDWIKINGWTLSPGSSSYTNPGGTSSEWLWGSIDIGLASGYNYTVELRKNT